MVQKYELFLSCLQIRELWEWCLPLGPGQLDTHPAFDCLLQHHFNQRSIMLMWFPAGAFLSIHPRDEEQSRA